MRLCCGLRLFGCHSTRIGYNAMNDLDKSKLYGIVQSVLLALFAASGFWKQSHPLFNSRGTFGAVGAALCFVGLLLMLLAFLSLGRAVQISPAPKSDARLVTRGVYRFLRHPIYSAIVINTLGIFLCRPTIPIGIAAVTTVTFLIVKAQFEQRLLVARYPEYSTYIEQTFGVLLCSRW